MGKILVFSGKIASGKTTLSRRAAEILGYSWASFGDHVRRLASERGISPTRRNLQDLGERIAREDPALLLASVLEHWKKDSGLVLDGLRHKAVLSALRSTHAVFRVHVRIDEPTRLFRLAARGEDPAADSHGVEGEDLAPLADLVIRGDVPAEEALARFKLLADGV